MNIRKFGMHPSYRSKYDGLWNASWTRRTDKAARLIVATSTPHQGAKEMARRQRRLAQQQAKEGQS